MNKNNNEITNDQIRELFDTRYVLRKNEVKNCFEVLDKSKTQGKWEIFDTVVSNTVHTYITDHLPKARKINIDKLFQTNEAESYDPFVEMLNSLEPWDGEDHIGEFANIVKAKDQKLWLRDVMNFLVAMVATLLNVDKVNHYCLVLSGKEGIGKTTFFKKLILKGWEEYYSQNPLDLKNKDTNFKLSQNFLMNIDELSKYSKKEFRALIELITRDCIQERAHYGKNQQMFVRRASFCATLNNLQFLFGEDGERRILAHEVLEIDYTRKVDMEKVYAQAVALYKSGHIYWESGEDIQRRREENSKYTRPNFVQELILQVYKIPTIDPILLKFENPKYYTCSDITRELINYFGTNTRDISAMKIGKELSKLEVISKMRSGIKMYLLSKKNECERNKAQEVDYEELGIDNDANAEDDELPF